jgi:hypothetical protein
MTKDEILRDLRQAYGHKVLLSPEDLALAIGRSPKAQANMRSRGAFPMPIKRVGGRVGVSVYALADYLADDSPSASPAAATPADSIAAIPASGQPAASGKKAPTGAAKRKAASARKPEPWLPARSRKSLGPALLGFRQALDFWAAVYAEIEAAELSAALPDKLRAKTRSTSA